MKMQLSEIARALDVQDIPDSWNDITISSLQFDSRKLEPGSLFVPLKGQRDGHDFIQKAIEAGAVATFWSNDHKDVRPADIPSILVDDPLKAMQKLAKYYLDKINPRVIAVTGSNGKTTTKDMTAAILATEYNVVKTKDNFNNEIGVPLTILGMSANTEMLVVEMGMDRPGQLHYLSGLVQPDIAVITMIGEAHIEFFKTRDKIADAKMEITDDMKEDGCFIFDGDEPLLLERAAKLDVQQIKFGLQESNDIWAKDINGTDIKTTFVTNLDENVQFSIPIMGDYNVKNALAAIAVGKKYRIDLKKAAEALTDFNLTKNRTQWLTGKNGERILSDVYNSNPTAAKAVLDSFAKAKIAGDKIVVLGDMLELGSDSDDMHVSLAKHLDNNKFEAVYLVGQHMAKLRDELLKDGRFDAQHIHYYDADNLEQLILDLQNTLKENDNILLKASHGIHLEKVVQALQK